MHLKILWTYLSVFTGFFKEMACVSVVVRIYGAHYSNLIQTQCNEYTHLLGHLLFSVGNH